MLQELTQRCAGAERERGKDGPRPGLREVGEASQSTAPWRDRVGERGSCPDLSPTECENRPATEAETGTWATAGKQAPSPSCLLGPYTSPTSDPPTGRRAWPSRTSHLGGITWPPVTGTMGTRLGVMKMAKTTYGTESV